MVKIRLKLDKSAIKKALQKQQELVANNVQAVLRDEGIPSLIDKIMEGYDQLSERASELPEDPTNPVYWREEFKTLLEEDLHNTFLFTGERIEVKLGDTDFLGYDPSGTLDEDDKEPLHWLVFYLEGLVGDWGFISPETYDKLRPWRGGSFKGGGRFGQGFMIHKGSYTEQGFDKKVPWDQVRHPFSGFAPLDIFAEALNEWRIRPFVQKAIDAAMRGKKL